MKTRALGTLLILIVLFTTVPDAPAITIVRDFIASGNLIPGTGQIAGGAPGNAAGGGNLVTIFNAAADVWQQAFAEAGWNVTLHFGWAAQTGGTLGVHNLIAQGGAPNRETEGSIRFDNDGSSLWFTDPTPTVGNEYATYTEATVNLGGGEINRQRYFAEASGDALNRFDLFTVALHEIGHSLGLSGANTSFQAENVDLDIDVVTPRPFPGTTIPTVSGAHIDIATTLMYPFAFTSERKLPSAVDILANCEISDCTQVNFNPAPVPEPASLLLLGSGLLGSAMWAWRRRTE